MSLTLILDVLLLASFFTWWIMTMLQQMASTTCIDFIAEMGRKTELSGGGLDTAGINLWMEGWGKDTEELIVS